MKALLTDCELFPVLNAVSCLAEVKSFTAVAAVLDWLFTKLELR